MPWINFGPSPAVLELTTFWLEPIVLMTATEVGAILVLRKKRVVNSFGLHICQQHYSGCSGLVIEYRTRNREVAGSTHTRSTASNLEQVANLLCLLAAPWVQLSVSSGNEWPHNVLRHHWLTPVSCHFRDCKSAAGHKSDSCKLRYNKCY